MDAGPSIKKINLSLLKLFPPALMKKEFTILIVDDDVDEHFLIQTAIKEVDYKIHVLSVYNGAQGIDYLLKQGSYSSDEHLIPDIILTDLNMPLRNGLEFLRDVKSHDTLKEIQVVVMSTSSDPKTKETCLNLGAAEYIVKPVMTSVYSAIIKRMISQYLLKTDISPAWGLFSFIFSLLLFFPTPCVSESS